MDFGVPDSGNAAIRNIHRIMKNEEEYGAAARDRTVDLGINSPTLYQLSYSGLDATDRWAL